MHFQIEFSQFFEKRRKSKLWNFLEPTKLIVLYDSKEKKISHTFEDLIHFNDLTSPLTHFLLVKAKTSMTKNTDSNRFKFVMLKARDNFCLWTNCQLKSGQKWR